MLQVSVTGRHFDVTDAIRDHAEEKIGKLRNHFDRLHAADLVLELEHERIRAELTVTAPHSKPLFAKADDRDLYAAVDAVVHRMERQIDRLKDRRRDHRSE